MIIKKGKISDLKSIIEIRHKAVKRMHEEKIFQWDNLYPLEEHFKKDIINETLYVCYECDSIMGFCCIDGNITPSYEAVGKWSGKKSIAIHRMIVNPTYHGRGAGTLLFKYAKKLVIDNNLDSIKVDTHKENYKMQKLLEKLEFVYIGYDSVIDRTCYEWVNIDSL